MTLLPRLVIFANAVVVNAVGAVEDVVIDVVDGTAGDLPGAGGMTLGAMTMVVAPTQSVRTTALVAPTPTASTPSSSTMVPSGLPSILVFPLPRGSAERAAAFKEAAMHVLTLGCHLDAFLSVT